MTGLLQDVRFALRQLRKNPGFTITATAMLAVAICANSTVFSWIDGTMLHPIPGARDPGEPGERDARRSGISRRLRRCLIPIIATFAIRITASPESSPINHDWITLTGGAAARADLHRQCIVELLRRAGRQACAGAILSAGRRDPPGRRSLCDPELLVMEDALWRRPGDRGQVH